MDTRFFEQLFSHLIHLNAHARDLDAQVERLSKSTDKQESSGQQITNKLQLTEESMHSVLDSARVMSAGTAEAESASIAALESLEAFDSRFSELEKLHSDINRQLTRMKDVVNSVTSLSGTIDDMAEQLNLISVNTAVEAARLGQGGFSVIAREIRKLADNTRKTVSGVDAGMKEFMNRFIDISAAVAQAESCIQTCSVEESQLEGRFSRLLAETKNLAEHDRNLVSNVAICADCIDSMAAANTEVQNESVQIKAEMQKTERGAEILQNLVSEVLREASSVRLSWHETAAEIIQQIASQMSIAEPDNPLAYADFLNRQLQLYDFFELLYVLDKNGKQISDNIVNKRRSDCISTSGLGRNRADREYYQEISDDDQIYISPVYISSASNEMCITVSSLVKTGEYICILAGDINISDLLKLGNNQALAAAY